MTDRAVGRRPPEQSPGVEMFKALDLPPELHELQNAYWAAEREWAQLRDSYALVLGDMLTRNSGSGETPAGRDALELEDQLGEAHQLLREWLTTDPYEHERQDFEKRVRVALVKEDRP